MKKSKRKSGLTYRSVIPKFGDSKLNDLKYPEIKNKNVEEKLEVEKKALWDKADK